MKCKINPQYVILKPVFSFLHNHQTTGYISANDVNFFLKVTWKNTFKYQVLEPMGRFQLEFYLEEFVKNLYWNNIFSENENNVKTIPGLKGIFFFSYSVYNIR